MLSLDYAHYLATNANVRKELKRSVIDKWVDQTLFVLRVVDLTDFIATLSFQSELLGDLVRPDSPDAELCRALRKKNGFELIKHILVNHNTKFRSFATIFTRDARQVFGFQTRGSNLLP